MLAPERALRVRVAGRVDPARLARANSEEPSDLPIEQPSRFDMVINMKTAKALGLKIPATVLLQATELIE